MELPYRNHPYWAKDQFKANRNRDYNIGERELAQFLELKGYSVRDFAQGAVWFQAHLK